MNLFTFPDYWTGFPDKWTGEHALDVADFLYQVAMEIFYVYDDPVPGKSNAKPTSGFAFPEYWTRGHALHVGDFLDQLAGEVLRVYDGPIRTYYRECDANRPNSTQLELPLMLDNHPGPDLGVVVKSVCKPTEDNK